LKLQKNYILCQSTTGNSSGLVVFHFIDIESAPHVYQTHKNKSTVQYT